MAAMRIRELGHKSAPPAILQKAGAAKWISFRSTPAGVT